MSTIFITGAAGALGSAVARAFDAAGANTVVIGRETARLERACGPASERRMLAVADLRDAASVAAAVHAAVQRFGRIDALCNIAGGFAMGTPVHATTDAQWDELFDLNVRSLRNAVVAVVPGMLDGQGGKIVNIASGSARQGLANMGAYCASKDVVIRLTESMSAELRGKGINVNCVLRHHRHAGQPCRHAECRSRQMGRAGSAGRCDPVSVQPGCARNSRRCDSVYLKFEPTGNQEIAAGALALRGLLRA